MNKRTLIASILAIILLSSILSTFPVQANSPRTVYGKLYLDGELATDGTTVKLTFSGQEVTNNTYQNGNYVMSFLEDNYEEGTFSVYYQGAWYSTNPPTVELGDEHELLYHVDLYVTLPPNNPPNKPSLISPVNGSTVESTNSATLEVEVTDPDDDTMNVSFYNTSDDSLIGIDTDVVSGGTASVEWSGLSSNTTYEWFAVAADAEFETKSDTWQFTTKKYEEPENHAPDKPTNPNPGNNAQNVDINPTLTVDVTDPDDDTMNVSFYNASDDSLIGTDYNVISGGTATVEWTDLSYNIEYTWYAIANDSELENKSDTWSFTTKEKENEKPKVCITKPQRALYIRNKKILPRFFRLALIFGTITIEANATGEDSGIEKVEFYINGKLKGNDTTEPYTYNWTRDRLRLVHIFCIKVVAYDNDGATAVDRMIVRKFL